MPGLIAVNRRLTRMATQLVAAREHVLSRCAADLLACAHDAAPSCSEAATRRCGRALDRLAARMAGSRRAGDAVATRLGVALLDPDDGLGYALLPPFCPATPPFVDVDGAMTCREDALRCTADHVVALLAPRVAATLAGMDGATASCLQVAPCGDGVVDETEECDDGAGNSDILPDHCRTTCREPDCGDGVVDDDEECDDGNAVDGDGCDADCFRESDACGDGVVDPDEECDDGNTVDGDGCDADCTIEGGVCGDGVETDDEECDDGNANSDLLPDRCRTTCRLPACGDGVVDPGEGEDCEPPGTLLCTPACASRLPLPIGAATAPSIGRARAGADPLGSCAHAIVRAGTQLFARTRAAVGGCVDAAARCVLDDNASDRCATAAVDRCRRAADRRDALHGMLRAKAARACPDDRVPLTALLDPDAGLAYRAVASACPFADARPPTTGDLLDCVAARVGCLAERAVSESVPRAYDFLSDLLDDPDSQFPCVVDPDELGSPSAAFIDVPDR